MTSSSGSHSLKEETGDTNGAFSIGGGGGGGVSIVRGAVALALQNRRYPLTSGYGGERERERILLKCCTF